MQRYYKSNIGGISRDFGRRRAGDMYIVFSRLRPAVSKLYHKHISFGNGLLLHCCPAAINRVRIFYSGFFFLFFIFSRAAGVVLAQYKLFLLTSLVRPDLGHYTSFMWNPFHKKSDISYWQNEKPNKYIIYRCLTFI